MAKKILITGASGLVGTALKKQLLAQGNEVNTLSRRQTDEPNNYVWSVEKQEIDANCLKGVDAVIHLAGEPVVDKKWTEDRKKSIIDSRVQSTSLVLNAIKKSDSHQIKSFIAASAVGFYGDCGDEILTEDTEVGYGFLADCCKLWENAVDEANKLGLRVVKLRTGIVLSLKGGALPQLATPVKLFVGAALGTGKQWVPWLHINDMVDMYIKAVENPSMCGAYNACAPYPITNETLTKALAKHFHRPYWPIKVPEFLLKTLMGERSDAILMSSNTSAQHILDAGYQFQFIKLEDAIRELYPPTPACPAGRP
ncbi:TIGR01777 family protein [Pedobacter changchengzhani]|uniref:TIGR01777 family protein n=1 Tax=Pedobacter changchengzhani TaxID=2529274 RepID=A0A4R5MJ51_9SPHI|nr:TIGR01777 family oxidoreductase [Pedobacter changchengzhani]TDG35406.1 TIGR01777 family protein [Pedobacter changchengzhani]